MRKRITTFFLAIILSLSMTATSFAQPLASGDEVSAGEVTQEEGGNESADYKEDSVGEEDNEGVADAYEREASDDEAISVDEFAEESAASGEEDAEQEEAGFSTFADVVWEVSDFTYTTIEQRLYGCDYSREFTIRGPAIAGFSDSGLEKLELSKDLVLPSVNDEGQALVGVAEYAFRNMGLNSVVFPTGMMVDYDDTVTNKVTRRGNFVIGYAAFERNNLTTVNLPEGIIAVMSSAFRYNKLTSASFARTIWWIETLSFANNELARINFPKTTDFQLEIHGMAFADNNLTAVKIPDYTEVINMHTFILNPGMEAVPAEAPEKEHSLGGVVYMYTDNAALEYKDRIHHIDKTVSSQKSWHQKLIYATDVDLDGDWVLSDFVIEGTVIKGFTESGKAKAAVNKDLVLPDWNANYEPITEIADGPNNSGGLFELGDDSVIETVELPNYIIKIGANVFRDCGIKEVSFPSTLVEIGMVAFQTNDLTSVILPDSVTTVGSGAFATNPKLERISLSKNMTQIAAATFGCSDATNFMTGLTSITLHEGITSIGANAFAGNNFSEIVIPSTVTSIGNYAFSTKNYLATPCTLELPEGLKTIGTYAFRNKVIASVEIPSTLEGISVNVFLKEYSDGTSSAPTILYVNKEQLDDTTNFRTSSHHIYQLKHDTESLAWNSYDFEYDTETFILHPESDSSKEVEVSSYLITGLSESGQEKIEKNTDVVIPDTDSTGKKVTGIGDAAFKGLGITSVVLPAGVTTAYTDDASIFDNAENKRGNFYIGDNAFENNALTSLVLPEGIISIGEAAFKGNNLRTVTLSNTVWKIGKEAFMNNAIHTVGLSTDSDFHLSIGIRAFASNAIKAVELPLRTEKVDYTAFMFNTGMEAISSSASALWTDTKDVNGDEPGLVYMYADASLSAVAEIEHDATPGSRISYAQHLETGVAMDESLKPWNANHFTYDSGDDTIITGLSVAGGEKRAYDTDLVIPEKNIGGNPITGLADIAGGTTGGMFGRYTKADSTVEIFSNPITSVALPDSIRTIGNFVFVNCNLTTIDFPDALTSVGMQAFGFCKFKNLILPEGVTWSAAVFASNEALESVKLPLDMTDIPATLVGGNQKNGMTEITLHEGIVSIGANAFQGHNASEIILPSTVKTIGNYAFSQAGTRTNPTTRFVLSKDLVSIGSYLVGNAALTEIDLPEGVTTLHANTFRNNTAGIVTVYTSNYEGHLSDSAPSTIIKSNAYHEIKHSSIANTGWRYSDFTFDGETITGWSEKGNETRLELRDLVLPDTAPDDTVITKIGDLAFKMADADVEQQTSSVDSPFGMESVILPANLVSIGKQSFEFNNLVEIDFPVSLTTIGERAFKGNKLEKLDLPNTVISIGDGSFTVNALTDITLSTGLTKIPDGAFSMNISLNRIDIPNTITEIGETAFAGARLTELDIPSSVTKIGRKAFHLHRLEELTIPGTVKEIGESAFEGTFKGLTLSSLTLEEGIQKIGRYAFKEALLSEVRLPSTLIEFGEEPFYNNEGADGSQVVICTTSTPAHLLFGDSTSHTINYTGTWTSAFFSYSGTTVTGLNDIGKAYIKDNKELVIPNTNTASASVTTIGANAFKGYEITNVTLPSGLGTINSGAFANNKLTSVTLPTLVAVIATDAFSGNGVIVKLHTTVAALAAAYPYGKLLGASVIGPSGMASVFKDVDSSAWYYEFVDYMYTRGIMTGLNSTTFGVNSNMDRAAFATVLYRLEGSPSVTYSSKFKDVAKGAWYTDAIMWASSTGVVTGYENGYYGVGDSITREQVATMMYRYASYKGYSVSKTNNLSTFPDASKVSSFASTQMKWAVGAGLITGDQGKLNPQGTSSRAVAATILTRFMKEYDL